MKKGHRRTQSATFSHQQTNNIQTANIQSQNHQIFQYLRLSTNRIPSKMYNIDNINDIQAVPDENSSKNQRVPFCFNNQAFILPDSINYPVNVKKLKSNINWNLQNHCPKRSKNFQSMQSTKKKPNIIGG